MTVKPFGIWRRRQWTLAYLISFSSVLSWLVLTCFCVAPPPNNILRCYSILHAERWHCLFYCRVHMCRKISVYLFSGEKKLKLWSRFHLHLICRSALLSLTPPSPNISKACWCPELMRKVQLCEVPWSWLFITVLNSLSEVVCFRDKKFWFWYAKFKSCTVVLFF